MAPTFTIWRTYADGSIAAEAVDDERLRGFTWSWCPRANPDGLDVLGPTAVEVAALDLDDTERDHLTPDRLIELLTEHYRDPARVDELIGLWFQYLVEEPAEIDDLLDEEQHRWAGGS